MRPELLQKLQEIKENPGFYRGLTPEEQAELFIELLKPKEEPKRSIIPPFIVGGGMSEKKVRQIIAENPGGGEGVSDHGALTGLADDDHTQYHTDARGDARYFTQSQITTSLSGKADTVHTHTKSQITDFSDADYAGAIHDHAISDTMGLQTALDGKAEDIHSHAIADVTGLQTALDGKSGTSHTHIIADVFNLQTTLNTKLESVDDTFGITVDGAGVVLTTGSKGFRYIEQDCTITGWNVTADQTGSIVFAVKRAGSSIAGTEKPTLSAQSTNSDTSLSTWTTSLLAGDIIEFEIESVSTLTRATLTIIVNK